MERLKDLLFDETNKTRTENYALAFKTTESAILDLFSLGGAGRNLNHVILYRKISQALSEHLELGIRCLLFLSDIRGGQGERRLFKIGLKVLQDNYSDKTVKTVINNIPFFTRWDYIFEFIDTKYEKYVLNIIKKEINSNELSLIYKWLPSLQKNTKLAIKIANHLKLSKKEYRQLLSRKRKELQIVERTMSDNEWNKIDYARVPSKASLIYKNAFLRHDQKRYEKYIQDVLSGKEDIKASVLYPHEIVSKAFYDTSPTLEALWKNLPNYVTSNKKIIPVVDVSGSMTFYISPQTRVRALDVSLGMGLYLSERLEGAFKDTFITFSDNPNLVKVTGNTLHQKIKNMENADWGFNTNLIAVFELILKTAVDNNLKQKELPDTIVVFTDMEFDGCADMNVTPFNYVKSQFIKYDYKLPQVVFWNLNARNIHAPVKQNEKGVILVSGYSPTTLKYVLTGELETPYELMLDVLLQDRYSIFKKK